VVGRDAADVDLVDAPRPQPGGQRLARRRTPLETGVRRLVLALVEHLVEGLRVQVGVEEWTGHDSAKSGFNDQWWPGSTWWSLVATTTS
jgi:hypothetical protein